MRRLQRLKPRIVEIVDGQLDAIEAAGQPADLVELFAMPIPSLVICELLGVPYEDRDGFPGACPPPGSSWATSRRWTSSARRWTTCRGWSSGNGRTRGRDCSVS